MEIGDDDLERVRCSLAGRGRRDDWCRNDRRNEFRDSLLSVGVFFSPIGRPRKLTREVLHDFAVIVRRLLIEFVQISEAIGTGKPAVDFFFDDFAELGADGGELLYDWYWFARLKQLQSLQRCGSLFAKFSAS